MKKLILAGVLFLGVYGGVGCGGSDGGGGQQLGFSNCAYSISSIYNGTDKNQQNITVWECSGIQKGFLAIYSNGTGETGTNQSDIESFTWNQTGCNSIDITDNDGTTHLTNITGSTSKGIFTFTAKNGAETISASCSLINP